MTASVTTSGTQTATVATEHSLYDAATAGTYQLAVDTTNLTGSEVVELRAYGKTTSTGGTYRQVAAVTIAAGDASPLALSPPLLCPNGVKFTLKQIGGSSRSFDWAVYSI